MAEQKVKGPISFDDDKIELLPGGDFKLIGTKCNDCKAVVPGRHPACMTCSSRNIQEIALSHNGTLGNWSVVMIAPSLEWKGPVPYVMGEVMMPEGPAINSMVVGLKDNKDLKKGMKVTAVLQKADVDADGNDIMIYVWKPV